MAYERIISGVTGKPVPEQFNLWFGSDFTLTDNPHLLRTEIRLVSGAGGASLDKDPYSLPDSSADIVVAHGNYQVLAATTLSANRAPTVKTTGAAAGQLLRIQSNNTTANTYILTSGGIGAATLVSCPASCGFDMVLELVAGDWQVNQLTLIAKVKVGNSVPIRNSVGDIDFGFCTVDRLVFPAAYATPLIDAGQRATAGAAEDTTVICRKGATPGTDAGGNLVTRWAQEVGGVSSASKYVAGVDGATAVGQHDYFSGYFRTLAAGVKPMLFQSGAQIVFEASTIREWSLTGPSEWAVKTPAAAYTKVWAAGVTSVLYQGPTVVFTLDFAALELTGQVSSAPTVGNTSGPTAVNWNNGQNISLGKLTGAASISAPTSPRAGATYRVSWIGDGASVLTFNAVFLSGAAGKWNEILATAVANNKNACAEFYYDGSIYLCMVFAVQG
jgi:hypothetical protein